MKAVPFYLILTVFLGAGLFYTKHPIAYTDGVHDASGAGESL
jgi:hypothetical protein